MSTPGDTASASAGSAGSAGGTEAPGGMTHVDDLAALVAIAAEATVSRTVLKAEGARVVMFTFDTGQELTEHTAAMPVLLQVLGGRLSVTSAGDTVQIGPGGLIHLTARLPHSVLALEPTQLVLTMLDPRVT